MKVFAIWFYRNRSMAKKNVGGQARTVVDMREADTGVPRDYLQAAMDDRVGKEKVSQRGVDKGRPRSSSSGLLLLLFFSSFFFSSSSPPTPPPTIVIIYFAFILISSFFLRHSATVVQADPI